MSTMNREAVEYLQNLDIKTVVLNGFDRLAVFEVLKELASIYEATVEQERIDIQAQLEVYKDLSALKEQKLKDKCRVLEERLLQQQALIDVREQELSQLVREYKEHLEMMEREMEALRNGTAAEYFKASGQAELAVTLAKTEIEVETAAEPEDNKTRMLSMALGDIDEIFNMSRETIRN